MEGASGSGGNNPVNGSANLGQERSRNPFARLRGLFRRPSGVRPNPANEISVGASVVVEDVLKPDQPIEEPQQVEIQEVLKPSQKVYFHAMPEAKFASVSASGLFGLSDTPTLSESLGYSLFLSYRDRYHQEYAGRSPDGNDIRNRAPEDYVLTIWQDPNQSLTRSSSDDFGRKKMIITTVANPGEVPSAFYEGNQKSQPLYRPEAPQATQFSADNMMASIPLTKLVRETILRGMVLLHAGRSNATQIEQEILTAFQLSREINPEALFLQEGVNMEDVVHNVVSSFERELVEDIVLPSEQEAVKHPEVIIEDDESFSFTPYYGVPSRVLLRAAVYRNNINEPELAQKLDDVIARLRQQMLSKGVNSEMLDKFLQEKMQSLQQGEKPLAYLDPIDLNTLHRYYSNNPTKEAAYSLMRELNIA